MANPDEPPACSLHTLSTLIVKSSLVFTAALLLLMTLAVFIGKTTPSDTLSFTARLNGRDINLYLLDMSENWQMPLLRDSGLAQLDYAWSPDGEQVAVAMGAAADAYPFVMVVHHSGDVLTMFSTEPGVVGSPGWLADNRTLVFQSGAAGVYTVTADAESDWQPLRAVDEDVAQTRFSPDGRWIAAVRDDNTMIVFSTEGDQLPAIFHDAHSPAWSPRSDQLVFVSGTGAIYRYDVVNPALRPVIERDGCDQPAWSPDGARLVFVAHWEGNAELYLVGVDGTGLRRLTHTPEVNELHPAWMP